MSEVHGKKIIYCFDSSAFMALNRANNDLFDISSTLWKHLEEMMQDGMIISHKLVFEEIDSKSKSPDFLARWIANKRDYFKKITPFQIETVQGIVAKFPGLIDYKSEHDQADPWLIALAIEKSNEQTLFEKNIPIVVSQESANSGNKIPAVCKEFGVQHRSLREFFDEIGLGINISKK